MTIILDGANGITTPSDVTIQSSGGGNFVIQPANSATDRTLTLPDAAGTLDRLERAGNVLQVVYGSDTTYSSVNTTTFVTTNVTASITPSSTSSKILIFSNINGVYKGGVAIYTQTALFRDGSSISAIDAIVPYNGATTSNGGVIAGTYLDSPATTSSITYDIRIKVNGSGTIYWNNYSGSDLSRSSITLMEIAA